MPAKNLANPIIANGASLSGAVSLGGATLCGIQMPAAWTAAVLTFQVSLDGTTYQDLYDASGVEYQVTAAANTFVTVPSGDFYGIQFLKVRSGTSAAPVNQGAARALVLAAAKLGVYR